LPHGGLSLDFRISAAQLTPFEQSRKLDAVDEITFCVDRCEDSGWLVASWDDPAGQGGITTQGKDLRELQEQVRDAVRCHFDEAQAPRRIRLHFVADPILAEV